VRFGDSTLDAVAEFHRAFDCPVHDTPQIADEDVEAELIQFGQRLSALGRELKQASARAGGSLLLTRLQLIVEEAGELAEALAERDLVETFDALVDLSYVVDGAYLSFGMGGVKAAGVAEVHRSNMTKLGDDGKPIKGPSGRVEKGPRFERPDLAEVLRNTAHST